MENMQKKNSFLVTCVCCIVLLLTLCYFGVNSVFKGTAAASNACPTNYIDVDGYCCPYGYNTQYWQNQSPEITTVDGVKYCTNPSGGLKIVETSTSGLYSCTGWIYTDITDDDGAAIDAAVALNEDWAFADGECDWDVVSEGTEYLLESECLYLSADGPKAIQEIIKKYINSYEESLGVSSANWDSTSMSGFEVRKYVSGSSVTYHLETNGISASFNSSSGSPCVAEAKQYYKINWNLNGGTDPNNSIPDSSSIEYDEIFRTPSTSPTAPTGKKFNKWCTSKDGSGDCFVGGGRNEYVNPKGNVNITLYATYDDATSSYNVTLNPLGGTVSTTSLVKTKGQALSLPRPTRECYKFIGWADKVGATDDAIIYTTSYTEDKEATLYARWEYYENNCKEYTITLVPQGGTIDGVSTNTTLTGVTNEQITLPEPEKSGYRFVGWSTHVTASANETIYSSTDKYKITKNATLYARWEESSSSNTSTGTWTATFYDGTTKVGSATCEKKAGESGCSVNVPTAPTKSGYTFGGWHSSSEPNNCLTSSTLKIYVSNASWYACWTENGSSGGDTTTTTYKITYYANGGSGAPSSQTKTKDKAISLSTTKPTRSGYTFASWNTKSDGSGTTYKSGATYSTNANLTLYAIWTKNAATDSGEEETTYGIIYVANGGEFYLNGSWEDNAWPDIVKIGESTNLPQARRTGYTFKGWYTAATGGTRVGGAGSSYKPTAAIKLYAQWEQNTATDSGGSTTTKKFTATFDANGGTLKGSSTLSCSTDSTSCTISDLPTATKTGYTFTGWSTSSSCTTGNKTSLTLNASKKYYACYTKNSTTGNTGGTDDEGNVNENVQTGEIAIVLTWVIGLFAIGYSLYYFKKVKQN